MKRYIAFIFVASLFLCGSLYAADGDLIVNGSLGVGTTSPQNKLHVRSASGYVTRLDAGERYGTALLFFNDYNDVTGNFRINAGGDPTIAPERKNKMIFYSVADTAGNVSRDILTLSNDGNVGIGTTAPAAKLHVAGNAIMSTVTATTATIANATVSGSFNLIPAGSMMMFAGAAAPAGWLLADGAAVSRTTYTALFAAIGTVYGAGDGSTTFNLPDFRRRVAVGAGGTGSAVLASTVGSKGGEEAHKLTTAEMPSHAHGIPWRYDGGTAAGAPFAAFFGISGYSNSQATGGDQAHNVVQPSLVVNYIIKY